MSDETYTFDQARARLDEIVAQVRKKDCSLEKSLDLLDEGVRLANICTEKCDHTQWQVAAEEVRAGLEGADADATGANGPAQAQQDDEEPEEVA